MTSTDRFAPAVGLLLLATFCIASMDTISKILVQTYSISQILFVRYAFFLGFAIWMAGPRRVVSVARGKHPWLLLFTGLLMVVENATFVLAFRYLPMADVQAVGAASPLIVIALSVPLLGEKVGIRRWLAVMAGFAGVLLIVRPGFAEVDWYLMIPVAGAFQWGLYQVLVRRITRDDSVQTITLWMAATGLLACLAIAPFSWKAPDATGWGMLLVVSAFGTAGHILLIKACQMIEVGKLQPYTYSLLLWAAVLGYLVFNDIPDVWVVTGAAIIIASGIYAWYRQQLRGDTD